MYIADLHIHSRYSRATSKECVPEYLDLWARRKGIHILGTGDFTHPAWRQELKEKLVYAEDGLYCLKKDLRLQDDIRGEAFAPRFVVSGEISSIYKKNGRVRKVHNLILLPGISEAEKLSERLEQIGNLHSDGRPILGLDSRDLLEITLEACSEAIFVPAHIWTPHFSMFGAFSGFDTMEECFEDLAPLIHAFETGLSSDPPMNWRLSALDRLQIISNSDAHSPAKLGREANLLDIPLSYDGLYSAIQEGRGLKGTIEFFPEEGKYHYDGHRKCNLCLSPREAEQYQGKCPVCGKKLTLGVSHRIAQLADREEGFLRPGAASFESLVPLPEVIGACMGCSAASVKVGRQYQEMLARLGPEFFILRECSLDEIQKHCGYQIAEGIRRLRQGKVQRFPGFDGEYGVIKLFEPSELETTEGQLSLFDLGRMNLDGGAVRAAGVSEEYGESGRTGELGEFGAPGRDETQGESGKPDGIGMSGESEKPDGIGMSGESGEPDEIGMSGESGEPDGIGTSGKFREPKGSGTQKRAELTKSDGLAQEEMNEEQLLAVRSVSPAITVIAGPGTGKTKTLVSRILYLLQNRRVKPSEITAVTFTNQAAREIRTRLEEKLGKRSMAGRIRMGTFHSICYRLLKASGKEFVLAEEDMVRELVKDAAEELGISGRSKTLRQKISIRKVELAEQGAKEEAAVQERSKTDQLLLRYQEKLAALGAWDFDDLMIQALRMAREGAPAFPYLLVDEFQDISPLQYRLLQAWSRGGREVFIIGDPDQAIYGFRGADCESFLRFCQEENAETIRLRKNYRSSPEILGVSERILLNGGIFFGGILEEGRIPLDPVQKSGLPVRMVQAVGAREEAVFIAKEINRLIGGIDMLDVQEGFACADHRSPRSFADIAVLYRTHRQAELLEICFKKEGIPYVVTGREEFLEEDIVRGSLAFFRSILNPEDLLSQKLCLRLLWRPKEKEGLPKASLAVYSVLAEKYKNSCRKKSPKKLWEAWIEDMGLEENPSMSKLLSMAVFYKTMEEMLTALAFGREADLKRCGGKRYTSDAVTLMTMHGAKGLEFPTVFLCGLQEGIVPLKHKGRETDREEERRLLYVAMTRAREELILTFSGEMSSLVRQIPADMLMREKARKENISRENGRQLSLFDR